MMDRRRKGEPFGCLGALVSLVLMIIAFRHEAPNRSPRTTKVRSGGEKIFLVVLTVVIMISGIGLIHSTIQDMEGDPTAYIRYRSAVGLMKREDYTQAEEIFRELDYYKDSDELETECRLMHGKELLIRKQDKDAERFFMSMGTEHGAHEIISKIYYEVASGEKDEARAARLYKKAEEYAER